MISCLFDRLYISFINQLCVRLSPVLLESMDMDPFSYLGNNTISDNEELRSTGASLYSLLKTFGYIGLAATVVLCGVKFVLLRNGNSREDTKKRLYVGFIIGILISAFSWLAGQILYMATSIG